MARAQRRTPRGELGTGSSLGLTGSANPARARVKRLAWRLPLSATRALLLPLFT